MKPLIVIIEDCPIQREVTRRTMGTSGVVIPDSPEAVTSVEISRVCLVVTDRFMPLDWEAARDSLLAMLTDVKVVEWTSSAGLLGISDEHQLPRASAVYPKSGDCSELKQLIQESLAAGITRSDVAPYFNPLQSIVEVPQ